MEYYSKPHSFSHALDMWVKAQEPCYGYSGDPTPAGHDNHEAMEVIADNMKVKKTKR